MPEAPKSKKLPWITSAPKKDMNKGEDSKFYNSGHWRKLRLMFLQRNPACVVCGKSAAVADHITPIKQGGDRYSFSNLQPLCNRCHNVKRGQERHQKKDADS